MVIALALLNNQSFTIGWAICSFRRGNKDVKELIVNLQSQENISICICDHQARDLPCVDTAIILSNCKIIAKGTPTNDNKAKNAYFGDSFKFN